MSGLTLPLTIAADHPAYAGHFPGRPILPGVVLLDAALHALAARECVHAGPVQLKSAKFLSAVRPGEALALHYADSPGGGFRFEIRCGERGVASGAAGFSREPAT
ncbi:MAG: hypothetical protein ACYC0P_03710 [Thiobacillus sp.]